ncbi:hypothetical protein A9Q98_08285 [Thalassotalea sp. 42_200_T64]|nr:hypothetical protein A9Q98_08285 [Thalassotalea sp. 42_200_T64]
MISKTNELQMTSNSIKLFDHYFNKIFAVSQLALLIAVIFEFINSSYYLASSLAGVFLVVGLGFLVLHNTRPIATLILLLVVHTCLATIIMWLYGGIHDEILIVYPLILIFAALLGSTKLMSFLFAFISMAILSNGFVNHYGFYQNSTQAINLQSAATVNLILLVIFVCSYFSAKSIKELIAKLIDENEKILQSKREIQKIVHQDALTGLPDRVKAEEKFMQLIAAQSSENNKVALLFVDLDDFKNINDNLGHQLGDKFLQLIATRIAGAIADVGSIYRIGGDEFIILLHCIYSTAEVQEISENISKVVSQPLTINDYHLSSCCSIGVSLIPDDTEDFESALKYADIALFQAKNAGRNHICLVNQKMIERTQYEFKLQEELRKSLRDELFKVHFQPKLDLVTNKIIGAEALLRWWHPTLGKITPTEFIPLAEKSGLIHELGFWVLEQSIKECIYWHKHGNKRLVIAVNLSPIQFNSPGFTKSVLQLLGRYGLSESFLELEITENLLIEQNEAQKYNINMLAAAGIKLVIDDFGKGYSNLAYIKKLNIHAIKIDYEFVKGMAISSDDRAIVTTIIDIAKRLGIESVAEGVETEEIASLLKQLGCKYAQGFLWSHALESTAFRQLLKEKN